VLGGDSSGSGLWVAVDGVAVVPLDRARYCGHFDTKHGCGWMIAVAVAVGFVIRKKNPWLWLGGSRNNNGSGSCVAVDGWQWHHWMRSGNAVILTPNTTMVGRLQWL
jgi:hypothetical protein